jgi:hypothetical protein
VVVNNAFSIPFDDGGDVANEDDAVVAAAAAAGFTLVVSEPDTSTSSSDATGVGYLTVTSAPSAAASNPDYDLSRVGDEVEEEDPAHDYQNVDNGSWDGKVQEGPRDYENAPSTTMVPGKDGSCTVLATSNHRTTSTSSNALAPYENVFKGSQTSVDAARNASTSSSALEKSGNVPVFLKTVHHGSNPGPNKSGPVGGGGSKTNVGAPPMLPPDSDDDGNADDDINDYHDNAGQFVGDGTRAVGGGGDNDGTSSSDAENYENIPVARKTVRRNKTTRKHLPGCMCGVRACKLEPVWWCTTCGSEEAPKFTAAESEACELEHRMLQASVQRQHPEMCTKADNGAGDGESGDAVGAVGDDDARMYSAPTGAGQTYAATTDLGQVYVGVTNV